SDAGQRYALLVASRQTRLLSGERVRVYGLRIDKAIAVESGERDIQRVSSAGRESARALAGALGAQQTAFILVNFSDNPAARPYTAADARNIVTNTSNFDLENSYGQ